MKYFIPQEFIPKEEYDKFGDKSIDLLIDPRIIDGSIMIREHFGKAMIINDWHSDGKFMYRGFRGPECKDGAKYSQHRFGRAIDFNIKGLLSDEVSYEITKNWSKFSKYFTTLEVGIFGWTHIDCRVVLDSSKPNLILP